MLNEQYGSVFSEQDGEVPLVESKLGEDQCIDDILISVEAIFNRIDEPKDGSALGPDGVPPRFLKEVEIELTPA